MAYKFDATNFDAEERNAHTNIRISFNLVDDAVIDPGTGKPTVLASTAVSINVPKNSTPTQAKTQIASDCKAILQDWYDIWKARKNKVVDWLTSNEAVLENYLVNNITF